MIDHGVIHLVRDHGVTHAYVVLELSSAAYEEISRRLQRSGYQLAFHKTKDFGIVIDMHGLAVAKKEEE